MTFELFITILVTSAAVTSAAIQLIKTFLAAAKLTYNSVLIALITSMAVGIAEIFLYYGKNGLAITGATVVYAVCMGLANAVGATTSYDLVKSFIGSLFGKTP